MTEKLHPLAQKYQDLKDAHSVASSKLRDLAVEYSLTMRRAGQVMRQIENALVDVEHLSKKTLKAEEEWEGGGRPVTESTILGVDGQPMAKVVEN